MGKLDEILTRGIANIIPGKEELKKLLESGNKLNIYLGIDPTATRIHLGHAVPLRKLQKFSELGHNVTFLIGDFTALIGDTSDKDTERPVLTPEQIEENFKTYKKQAEKILDFEKINVKYNSEWLKELSFAKIVKLTQHFAVGDFVGRELIKRRLSEGKRVGLHEVLYPVMQGYDSYHLDTDIQIGGTDQTFNMQAGRTLIKDLRNKNSFVLATEFLEGTDGRKMSKSWGNAIWLDDEPNDMYAKVMSIKDALIIQYFTLATNMSSEEIQEIEENLNADANPMDMKKKLAHRIVEELHGKKEADNAQENFQKTVQQKEIPTDIQIISFSREFVSTASVAQGTVTAGLAPSNSDAKRVIEQGGLKINNEVVKSSNDPLSSYIKNDEAIIQRGKFNAKKIKISS